MLGFPSATARESRPAESAVSVRNGRASRSHRTTPPKHLCSTLNRIFCVFFYMTHGLCCFCLAFSDCLLNKAVAIREHAGSDIHQQAWACWCNPAAAETIITQSDEDRHLLRGGVPQLSDWLRLWKAVRSTKCSLNALEALSFTDSFSASNL